MTALGQSFTYVTKGLDPYFQQILKSLPPANACPRYAYDPLQLPQILATGAFAESVEVGSINAGVYGALASSAINALWVQDHVLIIKMSDQAYVEGAGAACRAYPVQTACIDGVAHIFVKWSLDSGIAVKQYVRGPAFKETDWNVFGAYAQGEDNADHLKDYELSLTAIATSAVATQAKYGYLHAAENSDTIDQIREQPTDLSSDDLIAWNLPVCDIDAILKGLGKTYLKPIPDIAQHLDDASGNHGPSTKIAFWGVCACIRAAGWPVDKGYAEGPAPNWQRDYCKDQGFG